MYTHDDILQFLHNYGTRCPRNETISDTELMMDDHHCIEYKGKKWYLRENRTFWNDGEELLQDYIVENFTFSNKTK